VLAAAPPGGDVLVVDNDPPDDGTRRVVEARPVRYVVEPARGLNRARTRALEAATGEVVLFTDDDARVDAAWVAALLEPFAGARVGAACGLVVPSSLDTPASEWFERLGGMGRGFDRAVFDASTTPAADAGMIGAGVNLAVRRDVALATAAFVPSLDRGTPALSGGDSYALYRILAAGHRVAYTPDALVWHDHRSTWSGLVDTLHDHNAGGAAMLARCLVDDRDPEALAVAARRLWRHHLRPLDASLAGRPDAAPTELRVAALRGWATGLAAYARTRGRS
jgi:GT2 family glycosyltransferase